MIEFAPKELCEKLQAMGCKSEQDIEGESEYYWRKDLFGVWGKNPMASFQLCSKSGVTEGPHVFGWLERIPAFVQNDFTGATDQARKNASIVFGNTEVEFLSIDLKKIKAPIWVFFRLHIVGFNGEISQDDSKEQLIFWWQYLERTMVNKNG